MLRLLECPNSAFENGGGADTHIMSVSAPAPFGGGLLLNTEWFPEILFSVRAGRLEYLLISLRQTGMFPQFESPDLDRFSALVARPELEKDSSRPTRAGKSFKSADSSWKKIQVGRLELEQDSSRPT